MYGNYMNNYGNQRGYYPYFPNNMSETQNRMTPIQPIQPPTSAFGLLGKSVDSLDVVKAMDIPLDGSISYFPLTDGTAIVTKQLQNDGTSKTIIYKPVNEEKKQNKQYLTIDEFEEKLAGIDFEDLNDIKDLKDEIKNLRKDFEKFKTALKGDKK